jgi:hypothetical protein
VLDDLALKELRIEQQAAEIDDLRAQLHRARSALGQVNEPVSPSQPATIPAIPETFDALPAWIGEHLADGHVLVHPKAIRAARKSVFRDPPLVYRCLKAMQAWYYPMIMNADAAAGTKWAEFLHRERLRCGPTGDAAATHRTESAYQVSYHGKSYPLDLHIQGSSSRKEQDALRIYFCVSKPLRKILIGSFPGHLDNSHS